MARSECKDQIWRKWNKGAGRVRKVTESLLKSASPRTGMRNFVGQFQEV